MAPSTVVASNPDPSAALIGRLDAALAGLEVAVLVDEDDPGEAFRARLHQQLASPGLLVDVWVPPGCGDVDGWRRRLDHDDAALAHGIGRQVAAAAELRAAR